MEKIKINSIDKKPKGLVVVNYNDNKEATMNTEWQAQEVDFLEKDVGIGGSVSVEIVQKGKYINLTKVDFSSAEKGSPVPSQSLPASMSNRDEIIVAQVILKCATELAQKGTGQELCELVNELVGAYKVALDRLKNE